MAQSDTGLSDVVGINTGSMPFDGLLSGLRRLDSLLAQAIRVTQVAHGPGAAADPFRGLPIKQDMVARLLARESGEPIIHKYNVGEPQEPIPDSNDDDTRLSWLKRAFDMATIVLRILRGLMDHEHEEPQEVREPEGRCQLPQGWPQRFRVLARL